ncbi:MAG: beta-ribofuranosylaminobenzene 5'-phosphate synthase [Methylobacter sp.]|nr:MAG: beta-ribofuranosylaminobenzene 5'-phosphate synthase [Methylobacter sp.]
MGQGRRIKRLKVSAPSRLHLTLLAMHNGEYRINGGLGFAIADPSCELTFSSSVDFSIDDQRTNPLGCDELERLVTLLKTEQKRRGFPVAVDVVINGNMRPHFGFGSGSAISLACLEALHRLNGSMPSPSELVAASGRGGTSGVGIHSYFSGGCVFDLGRTSDNSAHAPSHHATASRPLLLDQLPMPDWEIGICIPLSVRHKSQADERAFFERTCPLPAEAVYETLYHSLFGLYAAIREVDKTTFCNALRAVQTCAWKKAEWLEYGSSLMDIEQALYTGGAEAVGMSSLGPSLFFLATNVTELINQMRLVHPDCEWILTCPANHGRRLIDA